MNKDKVSSDVVSELIDGIYYCKEFLLSNNIV
jgi:hypothetical protein